MFSQHKPYGRDIGIYKKEKMKLHITPDTINTIRIAMQHLWNCWDELQELEKEFDIEIETDELTGLMGICLDQSEISNQEIIEFIQSKLG